MIPVRFQVQQDRRGDLASAALPRQFAKRGNSVRVQDIIRHRQTDYTQVAGWQGRGRLISRSNNFVVGVGQPPPTYSENETGINQSFNAHIAIAQRAWYPFHTSLLCDTTLLCCVGQLDTNSQMITRVAAPVHQIS